MSGKTGHYDVLGKEICSIRSGIGREKKVEETGAGKKELS